MSLSLKHNFYAIKTHNFSIRLTEKRVEIVMPVPLSSSITEKPSNFQSGEKNGTLMWVKSPEWR